MDPEIGSIEYCISLYCCAVGLKPMSACAASLSTCGPREKPAWETRLHRNRRFPQLKQKKVSICSMHLWYHKMSGPTKHEHSARLQRYKYWIKSTELRTNSVSFQWNCAPLKCAFDRRLENTHSESGVQRIQRKQNDSDFITRSSCSLDQLHLQM